MEKTSKLLWGIFFIALGIIIGLNCLGIAEINIFFSGWWTLFIIVPSFIGLFDKNNKIGNIISLIIGIALFLAARDIITFKLIAQLALPLVLVGIGLSILFNETIKTTISKKVKQAQDKDTDNVIATFAEQKVRKDHEQVKSASLDAIFGGVKYDLTNAILKEETTIKASAIFGEVTIELPKDVNVKVKSTPIFGGVNNKIVNQKDAEKTIYIEAFCLFGGIEIK